MTDTSGFPARVRPSTTAFDPASGPLLSEKHWGFTIRNSTRVSYWTLVSQVFSFFFGAAFIAAACGLWAVQDPAFYAETFQMRAGLTVLCGAIGILLIRFANRGIASELQFDLNLGEVREVLQNRSGQVSLVSHFGLDAFAGLAIDRSTGDSTQVRLVLRHHDGVNNIMVAQGTDAQIGALFGRLKHDLLGSHNVREHEAVLPVLA